MNFAKSRKPVRAGDVPTQFRLSQLPWRGQSSRTSLQLPAAATPTGLSTAKPTRSQKMRLFSAILGTPSLCLTGCHWERLWGGLEHLWGCSQLPACPITRSCTAGMTPRERNGWRTTAAHPRWKRWWGWGNHPRSKGMAKLLPPPHLCPPPEQAAQRPGSQMFSRKSFHAPLNPCKAPADESKRHTATGASPCTARQISTQSHPFLGPSRGRATGRQEFLPFLFHPGAGQQMSTAAPQIQAVSPHPVTPAASKPFCCPFVLYKQTRCYFYCNEVFQTKSSFFFFSF